MPPPIASSPPCCCTASPCEARAEIAGTVGLLLALLRADPRLGAGAADPDLAAVGAVGVPDGGTRVTGDGEPALVHGRVVPFAEQGAVRRAGRRSRSLSGHRG